MSRDDRGEGSLRIERCPARYIKLGSRGSWEAALDEGTLEWGGDLDPLDVAETHDWGAAKQHYIAQNVSPGTATSYVRELREFCTLGSETLWITFARDRLWWAFAEPHVLRREAPTASQGKLARRATSPWRSTDIFGKPLIQSDLSSALTKIAGYPRTMAKIEGARDYLFRLLNAEADPNLAAAQASLAYLHSSFTPIIQQLHWSDFELLVDLIFARAGWQRVSRLGGTMKDHDLILEQPITRKRVSVQVKSRADQKTLERYSASFAANDCSQLFFITHNDAPLRLSQDGVTCWSVAEVAQQTVAAGLSQWLLDRAA